jgi:hypothetical protein
MSFQNPQMFQQTISLFPEQSTLVRVCSGGNCMITLTFLSPLINLKAFIFDLDLRKIFPPIAIVESPRDLPYGDIILHTLVKKAKSGNGEGSGKQHKLGQCEGAKQQLIYYCLLLLTAMLVAVNS